MHLPGRDVPWKPFFRDLLREIVEDDLLDYAGSVAFSAFLALFPFLLFVVALAGEVVDPVSLESLLAEVRRVAPPAVADMLGDRLRALVAGTRPGLLTLGAVGAIWAASSAVAALGTALNRAYNVRERRKIWTTRGLAILVTLGAAAFLVVASVIAIATPALARVLGGPVSVAILWLRWPVAGLIMLVVIAGFYRFLPDVKHPFRLLTPGSGFAVISWAIASHLFSLYVAYFGRYEVVYGALGGVIVALLWLWISACVILIGAEIDDVLARHAEGRTRPEQT